MQADKKPAKLNPRRFDEGIAAEACSKCGYEHSPESRLRIPIYDGLGEKLIWPCRNCGHWIESYPKDRWPAA